MATKKEQSKWTTRKKDLEKAALDVYTKYRSEIIRSMKEELTESEAKVFTKRFSYKETFIAMFLDKAEMMTETADEIGAKRPTASQIAQAVQRKRTFTSYKDLARKNYIEAAKRIDPAGWNEVKKQIGWYSNEYALNTSIDGIDVFYYDKEKKTYSFWNVETGEIWHLDYEEYRENPNGPGYINERHITATLKETVPKRKGQGPWAQNAQKRKKRRRKKRKS